MKTEFDLETVIDSDLRLTPANVKIVGTEPDNRPYVVFEEAGGRFYFIQDKDLKLFAKNLYKSLFPKTKPQ